MAMATITSKRQLTIPVKVFKKSGLRQGERVMVDEENGVLRIESALAALERLGGSVKVPKRFRGMSDDEIRDIAIKKHYAEKYKRLGFKR